MWLLLNQHQALGTVWWIEVHDTVPQSDELSYRVTSHLTRFEAQYSRFRHNSHTSILNRYAVLEQPQEAMADFFRYGRDLYTRSEGHFNCLLGNTLVERGYGTSYAPALSDRQPHPTTDLIITPKSITLRAGAFDPGGFGKGYVIDEIVDLLKKTGTKYFLINAGGDLYATSQPDGNPFTIYLEHPTEADTYLGTTTLFHQGFAASSPYKRVWKHDEKTQTHIIGATPFGSFVKATTARDADAFATAALLLNDKNLQSVAERENLGIARFHPTTQHFSGVNFDFIPLSSAA